MKFPKFILLTSLLILASPCLHPATSKRHNNFTDLESLLAFKSLADPNDILDANWTTNTTFCSWIGVECSRRRQRVTSIRLRNSSLHGTISPQLGNLSFLSHLDLANNTLSGHIPEAISRLHRLSYLNLQRNSLSGAIPSTIFNMTSLIIISMFHNNLSGYVPSNNSFIMLPQVREVALGSNQFTGDILSSFSRCHDLQYLDVAYNHFTGTIPSEFGNFPNLTTLRLGENQLTGTIPNSLGNLTKLINLDLSWNNLTGVIPRELGNLPNLQYLYLGNNNLNGSIPDCLSNNSMLNFFALNGNKLSGSVPVGIGTSLHLLQIFGLQQNQLIGGLRFLLSLSNCKVLQHVGLSGNNFKGALPDSIGNLSTSLQYFHAYKNHIMGNIPVGFGNLSGLVVLVLYGNELTGTIPSSLTKLHNLQGLDLSYNKISGSIPFEIGLMKSLGILEIGNNAISRSIPDSLGNISMLQHLFLNNNQLSSNIPHSLWTLESLLDLNLSANTLSGPIPLGVGNLKSLYTLDLTMNQLSGNISSALGKLQALTYLDLSRNSFQGEIPETLDGLISVTYLNLSHNFLTGTIPNSLANLSHLNTLDLSFNKLEGKVPNGRVFSNISIPSLIGNEGLCGATLLHLPSCSVNVKDDSARKLRLLKFVLPPAAFVVVLLTCIYLLYTFYKRRKVKTLTGSIDARIGGDYRAISYHELVRATSNFNEANLLGKGSFGSVFRGCLDDGLVIALKVLNLDVEGASKSFDAECQVFRMVRHRNLVKIISVCSNLDFKALILQFMPNGSLEQWLYSNNYILNLLQRLNIMVDVSLALEHLHYHHPHVVLHCDLKPTNVLLDEEMVGYVSDFGIAKLLLGGSKSVVSASMPGTIGYIAPEYATTGTKTHSNKDASNGSYPKGLIVAFKLKSIPPEGSAEENAQEVINGAEASKTDEVPDSNENVDKGGEMTNTLENVVGEGKSADDVENENGGKVDEDHIEETDEKASADALQEGLVKVTKSLLAESGEKNTASIDNENVVAREDLKKIFEKFGTVKFIDFRMGEESGYIRFEDPDAAVKARAAAVLTDEGGFIVKNHIATLEPVCGDAEKDYWSQLRDNQEKHRENRGGNYRGRGRGNRGGRQFDGKRHWQSGSGNGRFNKAQKV